MRGRLNSIRSKLDFWIVLRLFLVSLNACWAVQSWTGTGSAGNWHWTWVYVIGVCFWWHRAWNDPDREEDDE